MLAARWQRTSCAILLHNGHVSVADVSILRSQSCQTRRGQSAVVCKSSYSALRWHHVPGCCRGCGALEEQGAHRGVGKLAGVLRAAAEQAGAAGSSCHLLDAPGAGSCLSRVQVDLAQGCLLTVNRHLACWHKVFDAVGTQMRFCAACTLLAHDNCTCCLGCLWPLATQSTTGLCRESHPSAHAFICHCSLMQQ